jgi:hypothetical protein
VFVDHREAKGRIDLDDEDHTMAQLRQVYGAASGWMDLPRIYREMRDPGRARTRRRRPGTS